MKNENQRACLLLHIFHVAPNVAWYRFLLKLTAYLLQPWWPQFALLPNDSPYGWFFTAKKHHSESFPLSLCISCFNEHGLDNRILVVRMYHFYKLLTFEIEILLGTWIRLCHFLYILCILSMASEGIFSCNFVVFKRSVKQSRIWCLVRKYVNGFVDITGLRL